VCNRCLESSLTIGAIGDDNVDDDGDCKGDGVDDDGEEALAGRFTSACSSSWSKVMQSSIALHGGAVDGSDARESHEGTGKVRA